MGETAGYSILKSVLLRASWHVVLMGTLLLATSLLPAGAQTSSEEGLRSWTDSTGTFHTQAILLGVEDGQARLRKSNGQEITVAVDKLSLMDRNHINLPADSTVWPNQQSCRNSDPWLVENHDRIRVMKPRLLVLNFANDRDMQWIRQRTEETIQALAESTRYHGFANPKAPPFLQYEVAKYIDFRDTPMPPGREKRNSSKYPPGRASRDHSIRPFLLRRICSCLWFR